MFLFEMNTAGRHKKTGNAGVIVRGGFLMPLKMFWNIWRVA